MHASHPHPEWIRSLQQEKGGEEPADSVSLLDIARGMISHSSNANTEYLMMRLGLDNVNRVPERLGMTNHEKLFPIVSVLYIPYELLQEYKDLPEEQRLAKAKEAMSHMSDEERLNRMLVIHRKLKDDRSGTYRQATENFEWHDEELDQMFSVLLTKGTTGEYADLMNKINNRKTFSPEEQSILDRILDERRPGYTYRGSKGGSTAYVLTFAEYVTFPSNEKIAYALFFGNLTPKEQKKLQSCLIYFTTDLMTSEKFLKKVYETFNGPRKP